MAEPCTLKHRTACQSRRRGLKRTAQICAELSDLMDQYADVWPDAIWHKFDYALAHLYQAEQALAEAER